jgi:hypothetical protein
MYSSTSASVNLVFRMGDSTVGVGGIVLGVGGLVVDLVSSECEKTETTSTMAAASIIWNFTGTSSMAAIRVQITRGCVCIRFDL